MGEVEADCGVMHCHAQHYDPQQPFSWVCMCRILEVQQLETGGSWRGGLEVDGLEISE